MALNNVKVEVRNLTKSYGQLLVLEDVSFDVGEGEFLCIVGPTGCGKTTFLNCLAKLIPISEGEILVEKEPVNLKKHDLAYIFQETSTMPWLTVEENVKFGLKTKKRPRSVQEAQAEKVINLVGLKDFKHSYPSQLSTSMLQRVVIARAFAVEPDFLLMDEPYGQLDLNLRFKLEEELLRVWETMKTTVIFITHNIEEAVFLGERILVLTPKPTTIKESIVVDLPRPRDFDDPRFIEVRDRVTELIKWW